MPLYNLEQPIMACWNITEDIDTLFKHVIEHDLTKDEISNVLLGLKALYDMKFQDLFDEFEAVTKEIHAAKTG